MKANAPENIYIDDPTGEFDDHWSIYQNNDSIEYIRKDVFIEKVIKYVANHFLVPGMDNEIKDFVNYMEEE